MSVGNKATAYKTIIRLILAYGAETWADINKKKQILPTIEKNMSNYSWTIVGET